MSYSLLIFPKYAMYKCYLKMTRITAYMKYVVFRPNRLLISTLFSCRTPWKVIFFGSDDFSLESLKALHSSLLQGNLIEKLAVVTSKTSRLQQFALERKLPLSIWPEVQSSNFDVGLVASFGHLIPEHIISQFPLGILNVHASLLPRWRGAAPIVHAILNNDTVTGVTIMRIKPHRFDVGEIVKQKSCSIMPNETAPELTRRLAKLGAQTLMDCVAELPDCLQKALPQPSTGITHAPKVSKEMRKVQWNLLDSTRVYNLHRALAGLYSLTANWYGVSVKLMDPLPPLASQDGSIMMANNDSHLSALHTPGSVKFDQEHNLLYVLCADKCWIAFKHVGVPGKKPMTAADFYNGYLSKKSVKGRIFS